MADYPASVFAPTTKNAGDTIQPSHVNAMQAEITAIETAISPGASGTVLTSAGAGLSPTWSTPSTVRSAPAGRLTLTTALPVTTADVTAAGTLYYTPFRGNQIWVYSGSAWVLFTLTEISLALTLTSGKNYDVFVYSNSGTLTLELSAAWASDTTRTDALTLQDGFYVKSGSTSRLWLGTIRASGANTTEDSYAKRFVWNAYNRVPRAMRVIDTTDTWNYTLATVRQANGSTANQLDLVCGLASDSIAVTVVSHAINTNVNVTMATGIGEDSTSTFTSGGLIGRVDCFNTSSVHEITASLLAVPGLGRHFYSWNEYSQAVGTTTWRGDGGVTYTQSGISGMWSA